MCSTSVLKWELNLLTSTLLPCSKLYSVLLVRKVMYKSYMLKRRDAEHHSVLSGDNNNNVSDHSYADDAQVYFALVPQTHSICKFSHFISEIMSELKEQTRDETSART